MPGCEKLEGRLDRDFADLKDRACASSSTPLLRDISSDVQGFSSKVEGDSTGVGCYSTDSGIFSEPSVEGSESKSLHSNLPSETPVGKACGIKRTGQLALHSTPPLKSARPYSLSESSDNASVDDGQIVGIMFNSDRPHRDLHQKTTAEIQEEIRKVTNEMNPCSFTIVGTKMGLHRYDVLSSLHKMDISCSIILQYLTSEDLSRASRVCKTWRDILKPKLKDLQAIDERLRLCAQEQENRLAHRRSALHQGQLAIEQGQLSRPRWSRSESEEVKNAAPEADDTSSDSESRKTPLADLVNRLPTSPSKTPESPVKTTFQRFFEEGQRLKRGESLRKCIKCKGPAKVDEIVESCECLTASCGHVYCYKCNQPYHGSQKCRISRCCGSSGSSSCEPQYKIGSKQSKKNLRRLLM